MNSRKKQIAMTLKVTSNEVGGAFYLQCNSYILKDSYLTTFDSNGAVFYKMSEVKQIEVYENG